MFCKSIEQAQDYARAVYPDLAETQFEIPRQGLEFFTLLAGNDVIRMAKRESVAAEMGREVEALTRLEGKLPFAIPAVTDYQPDNHIMRTTRVPGTCLSRKNLIGMPMAQQLDIARQIGAFAAALHNAVPAQPADVAKNPYFASFVRDAMEKIKLMEARDPDTQTREHLDELKHYLTHELQAGQPVFWHGDLSLPNVMYDENTSRIGAVDFSRVGSGYAHAEMGMIDYYSDKLQEAALTAYEQDSHRPLDRRLVRLHHEALVITWRSVNDLVESYRYFHQPQPPF